MKSLIQVLVCAMVLLTSSQGFAANGFVSGKLQFWQKQGNYCPSTRDCTHANYPASQFDDWQAVREVQVEIVDAATDIVYGVGTTDLAGNFKVGWITPPLITPRVRVVWRSRHKDTRFEIRQANSTALYSFSTADFPLTSGTTSGAPQVLSPMRWGNSTLPNAVINLYDGAHRTWHYAFKYSGLMESRFTNVKVIAFDSSDCPTSCADGDAKTVIIDSTGSAFQPQGRIMHELGHIASYLAQPVLYTLAYDYPDECVDCGSWNLDAAEWSSAGFEEAIATFLGDVAMHWFQAPHPSTCLSSSACSDLSSSNTETSLGPSANCTTQQRRSVRQRLRFLWDVYDDVEDPGYNDTLQVSYSKFFTALDNYGTGFENHEGNEPWSMFGALVDNYDGRAPSDFVWNLDDAEGIDSTVQRSNNCNAL